MEILEKLDHPLLFVLFITLAVLGMKAVLIHAAKSAHADGLASAVAA